MAKNLTCGRHSSWIKLTHVEDGNAIYLAKCAITGITTCATPQSTAVYTGGSVFYVVESVDDVLASL